MCVCVYAYNTIVCRFLRSISFKHRGKMKQMLLAYGLPKEIVTAVMIFYRNMKVKVRSPNGDRFLRHCCWSSARRYISTIFVYNLLRLCKSKVNRSNKKNGFTLKKKKARSRQYPA